jgi:hypothetical protein
MVVPISSTSRSATPAAAANVGDADADAAIDARRLRDSRGLTHTRRCSSSALRRLPGTSPRHPQRIGHIHYSALSMRLGRAGEGLETDRRRVLPSGVPTRLGPSALSRPVMLVRTSILRRRPYLHDGRGGFGAVISAMDMDAWKPRPARVPFAAIILKTSLICFT